MLRPRSVGSGLALVVAVCLLGVVPVPAVAETAWVSSPNNQRAIALDTDTGRQGSPVGLVAPGAIAITPDGRTVYVLSRESANRDAVTPIDTATETAGAAIVVGAGASGLAVSPDGRTVLVTSTTAGTVTPISTTTNAPALPIAVDQPTGIAIAPDGATAYVLTAGATLTPIDLTTATPGAPIALDHAGEGIAITPDGTLAVVGETDAEPPDRQGYVQVVELPGGHVEAPVPAGEGAVVSLAVAPSGSTAYVGEAPFYDVATPVTSGGLVGFDIASRTARRLPFWVTPWTSVSGLAVSGDGGHLFGTVPCNDGHCITGGAFDLDTATKTVVREFGLDRLRQPDWMNPSPVSIALVPDPSATFTAATRRNGTPSSFDAAASSNAGGAVTGYAWQFGDNTPTDVTPRSTIAHTYARPGSYTATLTTRNAGGCAAGFIYTGQTASCTGSQTATTTRTVTVPAPGAHSGSASAVRRTRATLNGTIDAASDGASWHFEYGDSKQYGRATRDPAQDGKVAVHSTLTKLSPNRRYHYRLIVDTPSGSSDKPVISAGHDRTFRTRSTGTLRLKSKQLRLVRTTMDVPLRCASRRACRGRLSLTIRTIACGRADIRLAAGRTTHRRILVRPACRWLLKHADHDRLAGRLTSRLGSGQKGFNATVRLAR